MSKTAAQIRTDFLEFFRSKQHAVWAPSAVIPYDDPTLLFTNAGMNQFKPLFLGTADASSEFGRLKRAANSQPCIRAGGKHNDLDDVGHDTYHHTFFEMLGNWSFGDYFKRDAIAWAWELITKVWGVDPTRIHATYFGGDPAEGLEPDLEARDLWMQIAGLPAERVHPGNKKDNFWEMGDTGPCGPCSEMHIDLTPDKSGAKLVNAGDERVIEFWNLVFIQFNRGSDGKLTPLPAKHVDTGMGFERIARIVQGKRSNYDVDVFTPIFDAIHRVSGAPKYGALMKGDPGTENRQDDLMRDVAYRVIADHIRTLSFAIADGCVPDKDGRGFVLRRILRRAVRYGWQYLGLKKPFLCELVPTVVQVMGDAFPTLKKNPQRIVESLRDEEESFERTLDRGLQFFWGLAANSLVEAGAPSGYQLIITSSNAMAGNEDAVLRLLPSNAAFAASQAATHSLLLRNVTDEDIKVICAKSPVIRGEDAFRLHDTFGFPIDLTEIMAKERGLLVDTVGFAARMEESRQRARQASAMQADWIESFAWRYERADSEFVGYEMTECDVLVRAAVTTEGVSSVAGLQAGDSGVLVLDKTPFYAESGGQVGDVGVITGNSPSPWAFRVEATRRVGGVNLHFGVCTLGAIPPSRPAVVVGSRAEAAPLPRIPEEIRTTGQAIVGERRAAISINHTATHVLNWALREVLGDHIDQKGSLVDDEKTRFDFSHNKAVSPDELAKIESLVADQITRDLKVFTAYKPQADARKVNTLRAVFGEKYPDTVRVVSIGASVDDLLANPTNPEWMKFSVEFCGGTHVQSTREIGSFVLVEESAVAKGIRRVVGITGQAAQDAIAAGKRLLAKLEERRSDAATARRSEELAATIAELQKVIAETPLRVVDRQKLRDGVTELQEIAKKQQKQAAAASADSLVERAPTLLDAAKRIGSTAVVVAELPESPADAIKTLCDSLKQRAGSAAIFLGTRGEKATLLAAVTDDLVKRGVKAGDWIKAIAPIVEGGGGGPPTMAQAGGKNPAKLAEALAAAEQWVIGKL